MLARIMSYGIAGLIGYPVTVEADVTFGSATYETVGLPDNAVKESKERVHSAIINSGFEFPNVRTVVNLAPADVKKEGSVYDLPIAIGILSASGEIPKERAESWLILGELALDGAVRGISGVLPMVIDACERGFDHIMLPKINAEEAAIIKDVTIIPVTTLAEAALYLRGMKQIEPQPYTEWKAGKARYDADFALIRGQQAAKRAAEVAVSGSHNILMIGTPGSGKTMLARSIPSILPELTNEEALEITKIHSVAGLLRHTSSGIIAERPFRSPHHSASVPSLVGGGARALPGEISLSHFGVLFLDELPEFTKKVLESLRQPLEDGYVTVSRAAVKAQYPADFMLVAAMNPCPCGNYGSRKTRCRCSPYQIERYRNRISGPLLDRIDLHIEMTEVAYEDLTSKEEAEPSSDVRERVREARRIQRERFKDDGILYNSQMGSRLLAKYCKLEPDAEKLLEMSFNRLNLSARAYNRVIKVARTIADMSGKDNITSECIAEALQYRSLDKKYWGI